MNDSAHVPGNFSLESVTDGDFEELVSIRIEAMRDSLERIGRFDPIRARERFRQGFSAPHTRKIVLDGARVGFVVVKPQENSLLLDHLYIRPMFQGRGIGSLVLERVFKEADEQGMAIRVGALRDSDSNRFYSRHGFKQVDESEWDIYYLRECNPPT